MVVEVGRFIYANRTMVAGNQRVRVAGDRGALGRVKNFIKIELIGRALVTIAHYAQLVNMGSQRCWGFVLGLINGLFGSTCMVGCAFLIIDEA